MALSSGPWRPWPAATLYVDNVNGTQTSGCSSPGAGACKTIQEGVNAAELLSDTAVTLDVAGSGDRLRRDRCTINLPSGAGDTLDIEGTGSTLPTLDNGGSRQQRHDRHHQRRGGDHRQHDDQRWQRQTGTEAGGAIDDIGTGTLSVGHDTFSNNSADAARAVRSTWPTAVSASATQWQSHRDQHHLRQQLRRTN